MKFIFTQIIIVILISSFDSQAQYDAGTLIYSQYSSTNLTSISKNYIIEDFDGDFNPDIIIVKSNAANNTNHLTWHKGNGNGNFTPQANIMSVSNTHYNNEIFYEDMNADSIKDIVFQNNDSGFKVLLNDGFGNISAQINNTSAIGNLVGADLKEIADVDGDGDMDGIFFAKTDSLFGGQNLGHCLIGYNNGAGTFANYNYLDNGDYSIFSQVETGDIDGDGDMDIICNGDKFLNPGLISIGPIQFFDRFVRVYKNTGANIYAPKEEIDLSVTGLYFKNIKMQDINTDGTDELLIEYSYYGNCEDPLHGWGCEELHQFEVFDYDLQSDAFVTLEVYNTWLHNYYYVTGFVLGSNEVYNNAFHIQFGHQNADNNLDILSINVPQGKLHWYYGDGNGGFNTAQTVNFNNQYSSIRPTLRVADIDNDTDLDIFVLLNDDTSSTLTVFQNLELTPSCAPVLLVQH